MHTYTADESNFHPVYSLDMRIPGQTCPSTLKFNEDGNLRTCGKKNNGPSCDSVTINTNGQSYSKVLGRIQAYQYASPDAFVNHPQNIDSYYVDGISITYSSGPRKHVWTCAAAVKQFVPNKNGASSCPSTGGGNGPWNLLKIITSALLATRVQIGHNYVLYPTPQWSNIQGQCSFCGKMIYLSVLNLEPRLLIIWNSASVLRSVCG